MLYFVKLRSIIISVNSLHSSLNTFIFCLLSYLFQYLFNELSLSSDYNAFLLIVPNSLVLFYFQGIFFFTVFKPELLTHKISLSFPKCFSYGSFIANKISVHFLNGQLNIRNMFLLLALTS